QERPAGQEARRAAERADGAALGAVQAADAEGDPAIDEYQPDPAHPARHRARADAARPDEHAYRSQGMTDNQTPEAQPAAPARQRLIQTLTGKVVSDKMDKTVTVLVERRVT